MPLSPVPLPLLGGVISMWTNCYYSWLPLCQYHPVLALLKQPSLKDIGNMPTFNFSPSVHPAPIRFSSQIFCKKLFSVNSEHPTHDPTHPAPPPHSETQWPLLSLNSACCPQEQHETWGFLLFSLQNFLHWLSRMPHSPGFLAYFWVLSLPLGLHYRHLPEN